MPITSIVGSSSLTPQISGMRFPGPKPNSVITAAPFTPQAQAQADAINTGRIPNRGGPPVQHNEKPPGSHAPHISATPQRGAHVDIKV